MKTTLRDLIYDHAGGIRDGHQLKAVIPGGSSVPILLPNQLEEAVMKCAYHTARRRNASGLTESEMEALTGSSAEAEPAEVDGGESETMG